MSDIDETLAALVEGYLHSEDWDAAQLEKLELILRSNVEARRFFVRYCRMHTDLCLEIRGQQTHSRHRSEISDSPPSNMTAGPVFWGASSDGRDLR